MSQPTISIVIPVYNGGRFLREAIDSVLTQIPPLHEIIVVDDGSTDKTSEIIASYGSAIVGIHQENQGQAVARNVGIRRARGELIALLDADDIWTETHYEVLAAHLSPRSEFDFARGLTKFFRVGGDGSREYTEPLFMEALVGAAMYKRRVIEQVGLFDEHMRQGEDFDWNIRLAESGLREKRLDVATLLYRRHDCNLTNDTEFVEKGQLHAFRNKIKRARARQVHG